MAGNPSRKGKPRKRKPAKRRFLLFFLPAILAVSAVAAVLLFQLRHDEGKLPLPMPILKDQAKKKPALPIYEEPPSRPAPIRAAGKTTTTAKSPFPASKPRIAIIVDDMGYRHDIGKDLLSLDLPLSFAFLPFAPYNEQLLALVQAKGRDILLHLPLEAADRKWDPGPGKLTTAMDAAMLAAELRKNLQTVPQAIGVNNHMGSRFTADPAAMRSLLEAVRDLNLFFVDSLTSPASTAYTLAGQMGIKTERRNVFLDNELMPEKIIDQLKTLVTHAKKHGQAIGICHPHPATVVALRRYQEELLAQAHVVGIQQLVH